MSVKQQFGKLSQRISGKSIKIIFVLQQCRLTSENKILLLTPLHAKR